MSYTNLSKNNSTYSNQSETVSSVLSYMLSEDGKFITQEDEGLIVLEQGQQYNETYKWSANYSNLSK